MATTSPSWPPCNETSTRSPSFASLIAPLEGQLPHITPLESKSNRPLRFSFDYQMRALIYYHTEAFTSAQDLLQATQNDPLARHLIVPEGGLGQSTFYEANQSRGAVQMIQLLDRLSKKVAKRLKMTLPELGRLKAIDGSLIEATLSMDWADYTASRNKAKAHLGFDLNRGIPRKLELTTGKAGERPFVSRLLDRGETAVLDRGYQDHGRFDTWIDEGKHFVARVKNNTRYEIIEELPFVNGSKIFFFAKIHLGDDAHRGRHPLYLVGFRSRGKRYLVVTDRADLTADEITFIFSLRWEIETFFGWWKRHMKVYHLISRNAHGVLLQLLAGLITYLLLVLYCEGAYGERPSIARLRELRWQMRREAQEAARPYVPMVIIIPLVWVVGREGEVPCVSGQACRAAQMPGEASNHRHIRSRPRSNHRPDGVRTT